MADERAMTEDEIETVAWAEAEAKIETKLAEAEAKIEIELACGET
jgi:hypothetical protein